MSLRAATIRDTEAILDVFQASRRLLHFLPVLHSDDEDRAFIRDHILARTEVTVAEENAIPVGFVSLMPGWVEHFIWPRMPSGRAMGRHCCIMRWPVTCRCNYGALPPTPMRSGSMRITGFASWIARMVTTKRTCRTC